MSRETARYFFGARARPSEPRPGRAEPVESVESVEPPEPVPAYLKPAVLARITGVPQEPPLPRADAPDAATGTNRAPGTGTRGRGTGDGTGTGSAWHCHH
ncbi:hypothetical protein ACIQM4_18595 [Streptomyces sp. NPDC091272]|uniref:hypothetical protein n=1 Tax=Streptomyces sp. NPDC091272 TaxID=3365981 RepID=UPI0037F6F9A5